MYEVFLRFILGHKDPEFRRALSDGPKTKKVFEELSREPDYPCKDAHLDALKQWFEKNEKKIYEKIGL